MDTSYLCGFSFWRPKGLQKYATSRNFMIIYGILGTIQTMTNMYSTITLTTLERRFKIPSYITGFVFSGSEVSQVLLSLVLSYMGGQQNRPRWIAWGGAMSAMACLVMGGSHLYFGPGDDAIQLTEEYIYRNKLNPGIIQSKSSIDSEHNLCHTEEPDECSSQEHSISVLPLILIFCTRFVIGIGFTLYVTLGTPYLDDGVKRKNTPIMLATAFTFKMLGSISFILVNVSLRMYVDPWATPVITQEDPRWIGAWWFGYIVLGISMAIVSVFIGIFPEHLQRSSESIGNLAKLPNNVTGEEMVSLQNEESSKKVEKIELKIEDFFVSLKRLLKNKLVVFKLISEIFYVLAAIGIMVYYSKYMEVMFNRSAADASIITGPFEIVTTIGGFYVAAFVIGKRQPSFRILTFFSIFVALMYAVGFTVSMILPCDTTSIASQLGSLNLITECNQNCSCEAVSFNPVCDTDLQTTFFSPCHAGCTSWNETDLQYKDCSCAYPTNGNISNSILNESNKRSISLFPGACQSDCTSAFYTYITMFGALMAIGSGVNIGKALIDMRVVADKDKSFSSGLSLWGLSIFAMIPGRILYGYAIDSTCIIWNEKCGQRGNCQLYDQEMFRYYINGLAVVFSVVGAAFEGLTWYYGKNTQLYEETTCL